MRSLILCLVLCASILGTARAQSPVVLSDFGSLDGWTVTPSDGVEATIRLDSPPGSDGTALRLDYNFAKGSGFCVVRKAFPMDLAENYEFSMRIRGEGRPNNFEFKLVDGSKHGENATASGDDVWWLNQRSFVFPPQWQPLRIPKRRLSFAWGPSGGAAPLTKLGAIEFAIAASAGGKGTVWIDHLTLLPLPVVKPYTGTPVGTATSKMCEMHTPENLFDADPATAWESDAADAAPAYTIDFGEFRELGGLEIEWEKGHAPSGMIVSLSADGKAWTPTYGLMGVAPDRAFVPLRDGQARYVKLDFTPASKDTGVGVQTLKVMEYDFAETPNGFFKAVANSYPRGSFPRYFADEQSYWTVLGVPGDGATAAMNEEGAVELAKGQCIIEPFIRTEGKVLSWADGKHEQTLANGFIPLPSVVRTHERVRLNVTAFVDGAAGDACLHLCYEVSPAGSVPVTGELLLAVRPFQVLPPWQQLNIEGGMSAITSIRRDGFDLIVNNGRRIMAHTPPARFALATFDSAPVIAGAVLPEVPSGAEVRDPSGRASGLLAFPFEVTPGKATRFWLSVPFQGLQRPARLDMRGKNPDAGLRSLAGKTADVWADFLGNIKYQVPEAAVDYLNAYRAQLGYVMVSARGPALQPGTRTYDRSWIRDGASIGLALLEAGRPELAKEFIEWYAGFQYESGKVPCVVDSRGPDPVPEHDSHGQLIHAITTYYRFTGDTEFVKKHMPNIVNAVAYIEFIRAQRMTPEFDTGAAGRTEPGKATVPARAFYGLVPESISHEGYSAKPMHSYWDDFWILRGLKDAVVAAEAVGDSVNAAKWATLRDDFGRTLGESVAAAQKAHGISYIPGCVELGDFDPTSTAIGVWPCQIEGLLPPEAVTQTFAQGHSNFLKRRDDPAFSWDAYTPYEFRQVPALLCLGERDKALDQMAWFMQHRRPLGWNHWAEVVWKEENAPKFIGDMPHVWVGAEYMHAWRNMFAFERERDNSLVVLAGIPAFWFTESLKGPVAVIDLPTWYGPISLGVQRMRDVYTVMIKGDVKVPPGGIVVKTPNSNPVRTANVNGQPAEINAAGEIVVRAVPATVTITHFGK